MNFKTFAVAAALALTAGASFADDIALSFDPANNADASAGIASIQAFTALAFVDSSTSPTANAAVILQEGGDLAGSLAVIEQFTAITSAAMIYQNSSLGTPAVAYILQNGTTNAKALINQH
jgi:hypothetical protein